MISQVLFGDKGLVETLGPTWDMVHDPRFEVIESIFVQKKQGLLGGDATVGVQRQLADGTFDGQMTGIEQYSEILGEGRNMIDFLRCRAILDAISELYPDRQLRYNEKSSYGALDLLKPYTPGIREKLAAYVPMSADNTFDLWSDEELVERGISRREDKDLIFSDLGVLSPTEKQAVSEKADSYQMYKPANLKYWPDDELWKLIFNEYTNYFRRNGEPNQYAKNLFACFKADLLGLIQDYAEVANVQETVLLEDTAELYEPEKHGPDADRVSMEVEHLERALSYRAELRALAYQVLRFLGITRDIPEMTDFERDNLLKLLFSLDVMDDKPGSVSKILGFFAGIRLTGKSVQEREFDQLTKASIAARKHIAGLKDGSIQPISRYTEETVEHEWTPEEAMIQRVLLNPIAGYVFSRLAGIEKRIEIAQEQFSPYKLTADGQFEVDAEGKKIPENPDRAKLWDDWVYSTLHPSEGVILGNPETDPTDEEIAQLRAIDPLIQAQAILRPVFEDESFVWTDDIAAELLTKVEHLDPSPEFQTQQVPEGADPGAAETWVN